MRVPLFNELPLLPGIEEGLHALNGSRIDLISLAGVAVGVGLKKCWIYQTAASTAIAWLNQGEAMPPSYPLRLGFCHDCTLVQIDHTIPKEEMFSDYPYVSGTTATLREHFRETTDRLNAAYHPRLVVDIGSNDGTWLATWDSYGVDNVGVEADGAIAMAAESQNRATYTAFFNEDFAQYVADQEGRPDLITAAGVFFHLEELHSVCRGIGKLLADDGVLIVQAIYLGGMIENTAFDQIYHEHLCYYDDWKSIKS